MFFFGPAEGTEYPVEIEPGKTLIVKLVATSEPTPEGRRTAFFELNGQPREIVVVDRSLAGAVREAPKADAADPLQIGSPLPGLVVGIAVQAGAPVRKGQKLLTIEAMKMETTLYAERDGRIDEVLAARRPPGRGRRIAPEAQGGMTGAFVKTVRAFDALGSTSDEAKRLVHDPAIALPLLVTANQQTSGRGRGENRWWSDEGSLTFSLAFDPRAIGLRREHESRIALASAVAIARACGGIAPLGIRWPNDVECGGKKLGGLLPESVLTPHGPRFVLGLGLNVSTRMDRAPGAIQAMATSLAELTARPIDKHLILAAILDQIGEAMAQLADDDSSLALAWRGLDLLRGESVRLKLGEATIVGTGAGIAPDGSLVLRTEAGTRSFHAGQVARDT